MTTRPPVTTVVRKKWTRRDLFKLAPLGAVGAGALGLGLLGRDGRGTTRIKGTCRFCLMHCGIEGVVRDGHLLKVEGDLSSRTRGFVCEHGYALREVVHSDARLRLPLVRRGGEFHEVSWEEAVATVATKLAAVKAAHGARSVVLQTGWPFVRHPLVNFFHRFLRAFGSPNVATVASLCEASLRMGQALTVGTKYSAELRRSKTLLVWGANPWVTAPPFAHLVSDKARTGKLFVIDPVKTTLAKEATEHVSVRPGTDGALALGLLKLVLEAKPVSAEWLPRLHGLEELRALAAQYPVERVVELTSVPADQLQRLARALVEEGPVSIWQGLGVEHHANGVQTTRAITALDVLCGRFEPPVDFRTVVSPPTKNFHQEPLPALYRLKTPAPAPPEPTDPPLGRERFPLYERYNREAQGELWPDAALSGQPYPVRAVILWANNALVTSADSQHVAAAAEKLDLLVTIDPFFSESAQRSDVVLPAGTFAELSADAGTPSLVPPQGAARSDYEILRELAHACGLGEWFPWATFDEALKAPMVEFMKDEALQPKPRPDAVLDFGTPTGKVELASTVLAEVGQAALPEWTPPPDTPTDAFPLRLVTGPRPRARINSQFGGSPSIKARMREAEALVHPKVAEPLGLVTGAKVTVISPRGRISLRAVVTTDVHPECVVLPSGWGEASANQLISGEHRDPISGFPALRSAVCRLEVQRA